MADRLSWLAGLLAGEGCFVLNKRKGGYNQYAIQLMMTDEDVVSEAASLLKVPYIKCRAKTKSGKSLYRTVAHGPYALLWMLQLQPHMGKRRAAKIQECVDHWRTSKATVNRAKWERRHGPLTPTIEVLLGGWSIAGGVDNIVLNAGSGGATLATDDDATAQHQYVKVEFGGDGTFTKVTTAVGLPTDPLDRTLRDLGKVDIAEIDQYIPIDVNSGAGTETAVPVSLRITASGASIAQTYGSGNVDAGTQRVTVAADSTGVLSVDDNGAALTIDWAGTAPPIGAGLEATALRVTLATDSTGLVSVDDNA